MHVQKIKKRNGQVVDFDRSRIIAAITKAAQKVIETGEATFEVSAEVFAEGIANMVEAELESRFPLTEIGDEKVPGVEEVQDIVELKLVESDRFEVAKRYILYRAEHAQRRAEDRIEKLSKNILKVVKQNGKTVTFKEAKVKKVLSRVGKNFPQVDQALVLEEVKKNIFDGISTTDVSKVLVMAAKSFIERDPEYSFFTAGLLLESIYREVFNEKFDDKNFQEKYAESFKNNLKEGSENGRINPELLNFDLDKITAAFDTNRDRKLAYLGLQTLYDRYFIHINGRRIEAPQHFWMRVSMGLALKEDNREEKAIEFYQVLSNLLFVNSTPTLFNAGTQHSQLSSCYLSTVDDSLTHIFKLISDNAQLSKWAGGIGNDWTNVRATGAKIHGTNGRSQGVIPFLKIANDTALAVNQGGKRKGAVCAYLECWHYDYEEFLELRKNTGDDRRRTHDMNTASWIPDLFMKRVKADEDWTLFSPDETPELHHIFGQEFKKKYEEYEAKAEKGEIDVWKKIPAKKLFRKMVTSLFETGHPWMTFKDPCNVRSPQDHCGVVHDSNLCTEITLNNSADETAVCNLGSINLSAHFSQEKNDLDKDLVASTISTAMRMLDNVIDVNFYPTKETEYSNGLHRPVGLGMMGFHDLLYKKGLNFDSDLAVDFADEMTELISYHALLNSSKLAKERGTYKSYPGSKWDRGLLPVDTIQMLKDERGEEIHMNDRTSIDWTPVREHIKAHGMRNSNCLAIAPTATIANICGCVPCIEPIYKNLYVKSNMGGEFTVLNPHLVEDLKKANIWNAEMYQLLKAEDGSVQNIQDIPLTIRNKYKEVFEVGPKWIIKHASARQKWLDQAQSTNIFYRGTSGRDIADAYMMAWEYGLKTTYYLRTLGATQVQKSTISIDKQKITQHDGTAGKPAVSAEAAAVCSIMNGASCEACQ